MGTYATMPMRRWRVREIAERLQKNPGSVSRWVTEAAERRSSDSDFAKRLSVLDEETQNYELQEAGSDRDP
jgi:transposase-like protein